MPLLPPWLCKPQLLCPLYNTSSFVPAGQSTQMIIGATLENDYELLKVTQTLYQKFDLKRVFFSAYIPLNEDSLLPNSPDTPPPLLGTPSVSGRLAAALLRLS